MPAGILLASSVTKASGPRNSTAGSPPISTDTSSFLPLPALKAKALNPILTTSAISKAQLLNLPSNANDGVGGGLAGGGKGWPRRPVLPSGVFSAALSGPVRGCLTAGGV